MKRKLLAMIICFVIVVNLMQAELYAEDVPGYDSEGHNSWGDEYQYNEEGHWLVCEECGEISTIFDHTFIETINPDGSTISVCSVCGYKAGDYVPHIHQFKNPTWTWSDDYSIATAHVVCQLDAEHVYEQVAETEEYVYPQTCLSPGEIVYIANVYFVLDESGDMIEWYKDTKNIVTAPALGHDWSEPEWQWNYLNGTATATFTCENDPEHINEVTEEYKTVNTATCESGGLIYYIVTVEFEGKEYTANSTDDPDFEYRLSTPTGHDWGEPVWEWKDDGTATVTVKCANNVGESSSKAATVTIKNQTVATCENAGQITYLGTAVFTNKEGNEVTFTDEHRVDIEALGHNWDAGTITKSATCTGEGVKTYTCQNDASHTRTESVAAIGHDWDAGVITKSATCTEEGVKTYTCQNDASHTRTESVATLGHNWDEGTITKEPTCAEEGVKTYTCQNDASHTRTESVAAIGHDWDEGVITKAPTCTEEGVKTYTCRNDASHTRTESVAAIGHDWNEGIITKKPTCTEKGVRTYTCKHDEAHTRTESVEAIGHDWNGGEITTAPTCTETGVKIYTCKHDGTHTRTESIGVLGHDWNEGTVTKTPTCTEEGVRTYVCKHDEAHTRTESVEALGHDWNEGEITTVPTCIGEGVRTYTCKNDTSHIRAEFVAPNGHSPGTEWYSDQTAHWNSCSVCGTALERIRHISAGAATEQNPESCAVCGYILAPKLPLTSSVFFKNTGSLELPDLTFVKDEQTDTYSVTLPSEIPAYTNYYFEGWSSSVDTILHKPGSSFTYTFEEYKSVTFSAEWTKVIGVGTYDLQGNTRYHLAEGSYQVDGDDTIYMGDQTFYLGVDGNYTLREGR